MSEWILPTVWLGVALLVMVGQSALAVDEDIYTSSDAFFFRVLNSVLWPLYLLLFCVFGPGWLVFKAAEWLGTRIRKRWTT